MECHGIATAGWRALAIAYALLIAWFTVLPSRISRALLVIDVDALVDPRLVGALAIVGALIAGAILAVTAWRRRRIWTARLSCPLFRWLVLGLIGLAMLVVISQPPWYLARRGLGEIAWITGELDARHGVFYAGFAIVTALAWRDRVSLPALGGVLMAYGFALEVAQLFVPTRTFLVEDLVSNGVGILLGLGWMHLYHSLLGEERTRLSRPRRGRRLHRRARGHGVRASVQPRGP
jgi:hypothetical protein